MHMTPQTDPSKCPWSIKLSFLHGLNVHGPSNWPPSVTIIKCMTILYVIWHSRLPPICLWSPQTTPCIPTITQTTPHPMSMVNKSDWVHPPPPLGLPIHTVPWDRGLITIDHHWNRFQSLSVISPDMASFLQYLLKQKIPQSLNGHNKATVCETASQ